MYLLKLFWILLTFKNLECSQIIFAGDILDICFRWTLRKGEYTYIPTDPDYIKWPANNNETIKVDIKDDHGHPSICAPLQIKKGSNDTCWALILYKWAYKIVNDSLILNLGSLYEKYASENYQLLPNSSNAMIKCFSGIFDKCSSGTIKFSLPKEKHNYPDKINSTIQIFNQLLDPSSFTFDIVERLRLCFNTTGYLDPCKERFIINKPDFVILSNNSLYAKAFKKIYKEGQYEIRMDGSALVSHCYEDIITEDLHDYLQTWITAFALGISLICLLLHFMISLTFGDHRTFPGKILFSLAAALFLSQALFVTRSVAVSNPLFCQLIAICLHYFFLANFFWMGIIAFNMWRMLHSPKMQILSKVEEKRRFVIYSLGGWIMPIFVVIPCLLLHLFSNDYNFKSAYSIDFCWISKKYPLILFFMIPLMVILLVNIFFFSVTSYSIYKADKSSKTIHKPGEDRSRFAIYWKLAVIMGLGWIFYFLTVFTNSIVFSYLYIIANVPQGLYIFIGFTCVKKVRDRTRQGIVSHLSLRKSSTPIFTKTTVTKNSVETNRSVESLSDSKI